MKSIKYPLLLALSAIIFNACNILYLSQANVMDIQKGMKKEEVHRLLGNPDYRRFDQGFEEWEYVRQDKILRIGFYNNLVEMMDTYPNNRTNNSNTYPPVNANYPPYPPRNPHVAEQERDFGQFYSTVKEKTFKDDRLAAIKAGTYNRNFTCNQCVRLMSLFDFDDEKLTAFNHLASYIFDWENHDQILESFSFISTRNKAKATIDSILNRQ